MIAYLTLYPPNPYCTNQDCIRTKEMKRQDFRQVVVYTLSGAQRAWSVHLYCPGQFHQMILHMVELSPET